MMVLLNLPNIIAFFDNGSTRATTILVFDETNKGLDVKQTLNEQSKRITDLVPGVSLNFEETDYYMVLDEVDYQGSDAIIHLYLVEDNLKADIYKLNLDGISESVIIQALTQLKYEMWVIDKTPEEINLVGDFLSPLNYEIIFDGQDNTTRDMILSVLSMLISIPIFLLLIMSVQFVGVDIIEEKSTKAIEYVMSTIPPQTHFMTKILSAFTFLIVQALLIFLYGLIGGLISTQILGASGSGLSINEIIGQFTETDAAIIGSVLNALPTALFVTLTFTVVGGLFFMIFMATLASMSTSMEDYQSFQSPFMFVMVIGFYMSIFSIYMGDAIFLKVVAFIPLFSPIVVPTLFMSGVFSAVEAFIAFIILLASTVGIYYLLQPVYKASILSYDQSSFFKRIYKMFKRSKEI